MPESQAAPPAPETPPASRRRLWLRRLARFLLAAVAALAAVLGGAWFWFTHRSPPSPLRRELFQGVTYVREVRRLPAPMVSHLLIIDLRAPGMGFLVTPGDAARTLPLNAKRTSTFLKEHRLQAAINGDFYFPWYFRSPLDYYPREGDGVQLEGIAVSGGVLYSDLPKKWTYPILAISQDNRAWFAMRPHPADLAANVISGDHIFMIDGTFGTSPNAYHRERQPRTAVGLTADGRTMVWAVVDGRQPSYSDGATMAELAEVLKRHGVTDALNLDGGGSAVLVAQGKAGRSDILSCPIDWRIPGKERPVANHLGLFARPLAASSR
jgi:hypothetical protein